jgi:hypothetical protein
MRLDHGELIIRVCAKHSRAPALDDLNPIVEDRGRGRVLLDEVLPLELGPKFRRDRRLHGETLLGDGENGKFDSASLCGVALSSLPTFEDKT